MNVSFPVTAADEALGSSTGRLRRETITMAQKAPLQSEMSVPCMSSTALTQARIPNVNLAAFNNLKLACAKLEATEPFPPTESH